MMIHSKHTPEKSLYKSRSYRASFNEAYHLLAANPKTFFKSLILPASAIGLISAITFAVMRISSYLASIIEFSIAALVIVYLTSVLIYSFSKMMKNLLKEQKLGIISWKSDWKALLVDSLPTFYLILIQIIVIVALAFLTYRFSAVSHYLWIGWGLVVMYLIVPCHLSLSSMLYDDSNLLRSLKRGFALSIRYYGSTLMLLFVSFIIFLTVFLVCFLPLYILNQAINASNYALLIGDPSDLPAYVYVLHFLLSFVLISIIFFSIIICVLPQFYHYLSILTKEKDLKKKKDEMTASYYNEEDPFPLR